MIAGIEKINNFIDSREGVQNQETEKQENPDNTKKTQSLTQSYSVNQNLNLKNKGGIYQSINTNYSTQTNPNLNDKSTPNYEQNLDIYGDEQLFRQEDAIVFSIFEFIFLFNFELIYIILLLFNFSFSFSFLVSILLIYTLLLFVIDFTCIEFFSFLSLLFLFDVDEVYELIYTFELYF